MTVETKELLPNIPITSNGDMPSLELLELMQRLKEAVDDHEARIVALEGA